MTLPTPYLSRVVRQNPTAIEKYETRIAIKWFWRRGLPLLFMQKCKQDWSEAMNKTTIELCPICKYPDAECEHLGNHQHFWHCDDCGDNWLAAVGYECEVCPTDEVAQQPAPADVLSKGKIWADDPPRKGEDLPLRQKE